MLTASRSWRLVGTCIVVLCLVSVVFGDASAIKVMSWNTLNYPGSTASLRNPAFQAVIAAAAPDILVCQELTGLSGANTFRNSVLLQIDPTGWAMAPFTDGPGSDNALYYRAGEWTVVNYGAVNSYPREIDWYQMRRNGPTSGTGADFVVYVAHLKASTGTTNEEYRRQTAAAIRAHAETWPAGTAFVVAGDFNLYSSSEPAWTEFTGVGSSPDGRFFDPINFAGNWHTNPAYAFVHTQSTRTTSIGDGGSTGGCDDRFDFLLINDDLTDGAKWEYVSGTYTAYGQDGQHYDLAINAPPTNAAVGQVLADHLHRASDHLPIIVQFSEPAALQVTPEPIAFGTVLEGSAQQTVVQLANVASVPAEDLTWFGGAPPGISIIGSTNGTIAPAATHDLDLALDTSAAGTVAVSLFLSTNAPGQETTWVPVTGTVVRGAVPSVVASSQVLADTLDFGEHAEGEFGNVAFDVHNVGFDSLQAELTVTAAQITGPDASRFSLVGSLPATVGATPAPLQVAFDDAGVTASSAYHATLTLSCSDAATVSGGVARPDIVLDLTATVSGGGTATPPVAAVATRLHSPMPTPFNPATEIRFDLARGGRVRIDVLDIRGRLVDVLVDGRFGPGQHSEVWRGVDRNGRAVSSGVYLFRMRTPETVQVTRGVLVR